MDDGEAVVIKPGKSEDNEHHEDQPVEHSQVSEPKRKGKKALSA